MEELLVFEGSISPSAVVLFRANLTLSYFTVKSRAGDTKLTAPSVNNKAADSMCGIS
jgi:hypothetical protein